MANLVDRYCYRVVWSEKDQEYVALCAEFPSLSWLADSKQAALAGIEKVVAEVLHDMESTGETPPQPLASKTYSGTFKVRIVPALHRLLAIEAAEANVSLNRLVSVKLAR